jgi:hypothetical protein
MPMRITIRAQYRQGDVLLCAVDRIPPDVKPVPHDGDRVVVAEGELTGHAHAFAADRVTLFREKGSQRSFLAVGEGGASLCHEEHGSIQVPEGQYELRHQREYAPRGARRVGD